MKRLYIILICLFPIVSISSSIFAQNQYFVSPKGNDSYNGSIEAPFQTIERAQIEARKAQGTTTIYLREGVYRLVHPLIFTPEDGGEDKPLIIRAFQKEKVVLSGGKVS